jgi:putative spermidine/putrescine transport system permease protein
MQEQERSGWRGAALAWPALLLVVLFLMAPLALILRYSFDRYDPAQLMLGIFELSNYVKAFTDPFYQGVLGTTASSCSPSRWPTASRAWSPSGCAVR